MTVTGAVSGGLRGELSDAMTEEANRALAGMAQLADIEPIGASAAGVLYAATDMKLERRVAVRLLNPLTDEADRIRFDRESKAVGLLSAHPNVVTVYDAGFAPGDRPFLIMELIEGDDLATVLARQGSMPWQVAADVALQICAGLEQAHRSGALHRHLRPENILMSGINPKLGEFGISALEQSVEAGESSEIVAWLHRAPEVLGGFWDERTDLYSVASILYQMIDGHSPFWRPGRDSLDALRLRLRHEAPPPLDPQVVPPVLSVFIAAALSKDPFDRPQSADEFAHELRLIRDGRTTGSTPSVLHGTTGGVALSEPVPRSSPRPEPTSLWATPAAGEVSHEVGQHGGGEPSRAPDTVIAGSMPAPPRLPATGPPPSPTPQGGLWMAPGHQGTTLYPDFGQPVTAPDEAGQAAVGLPWGAGPDRSPDFAMQFADPGTNQHGPGRGIPFGGQVRRATSPGPDRSNGFLAAMVMIALGLVGLIGVVAFSALRSNDRSSSAPVLPDPDQTSAVEALVADGATPTTAGSVAMTETTTETTAVTAEQMSTTLTTIPRFEVPSVVGLDIQAASRRLADQGFDVLIVGTRSNAPARTVTQQKPDAGAMVTLPLTVTLYIPKVFNLPSMVGRSADAVCLELQALSLTCNRVLQNDDQVPAGSVIATNPVEGAQFNEGSTVEVIVSRGPVTTVAVPDVAGQTRAEAQATLMGAGFTVIAYAPQPSASVEKDRAVGSNPGAGSALPTDQPVTVLVSSGPPAKVSVPEVIGMSEGDALSRLTEAGLNGTTVPMDLPADDPGIGMVLDSDPAPGTAVDAGSAVTLTVGRQQA